MKQITTFESDLRDTLEQVCTVWILPTTNVFALYRASFTSSTYLKLQ